MELGTGARGVQDRNSG